MAGNLKDPQFRRERAIKAGRASGEANHRQARERHLAAAVEAVVTQADELTATQLYALRVVLNQRAAIGDSP